MSYYPLWFTTNDDILVLSTTPTSDDTIRTDDALLAFATMHRGVVLDLRNMDYFSSSMIGAGIHLKKLLQPIKKRLKMVISNPEILETLKIAGITRLQLVFSTLDEAVKSNW